MSVLVRGTAAPKFILVCLLSTAEDSLEIRFGYAGDKNASDKCQIATINDWGSRDCYLGGLELREINIR